MNGVQFANWLPTLLSGLKITVLASVISIAMAIAWGCTVSMIIAMSNKILTPIFRLYTSIFRNSPLLVQMFFFYYALPYVGIKMSAVVCGVIAITLNEGAFVAEILRGSIKNIPKQEVEAAYSLGLTKFQVVTKVIFPLALRSSVPMITGQSSIVIKDTSLFSMIMILDLTRAGSIFYSQFFSTTAFYIVGLFYILLFMIFSVAGKQIETRVKISR
jgi:His/Glu/Gln/Arg/opine family amino acid ABC transporter permease subunit